MAKMLTIQDAIDEFDLYPLYSDIIETYGEHLEDPSLVSDLYDLIDELEEEFEFQPDQEGDYSESFEKNLIEAIHSIVEDNEDLEFSSDELPDDIEFSPIISGSYEKDSNEIEIDLDEDEDDEINV